MNKTEVAQLLTLASVVDSRQVIAEMVDAWFLAIGALEYVDAEAALPIHWRESTEYLLPAHVWRIGRRLEEERLYVIERDRAAAERDELVVQWASKHGVPIDVARENIDSDLWVQAIQDGAPWQDPFGVRQVEG